MVTIFPSALPDISPDDCSLISLLMNEMCFAGRCFAIAGASLLKSEFSDMLFRVRDHILWRTTSCHRLSMMLPYFPWKIRHFMMSSNGTTVTSEGTSSRRLLNSQTFGNV